MEAKPSTPPNTEIATNDSSRCTQGRWIARIGVALFTGPVWGMIGAMIGMIRAYTTLAVSGEATPDALASDISVALLSTMIGIITGLAGAVLILVALFGAKNRKKWFFWWPVLLSTIWRLSIFPYGMIVGVPILILFITKRAEFVNPTKAPQDVTPNA